MKVASFQRVIESWAPKEIAWERDNVGLQCGDPDDEVKGVLVTLDVTEEVIGEAGQRQANLIVSHHPLLFRPVSMVSARTATGRSLAALLRQGISLIAAHTNLDFTHDGTSFALARRLGLVSCEMLHATYQIHKKIITYVPAAQADAVAAAMSSAGAGVIGNYEQCSFRVEGTGTFKGGEEAKPVIGTAGVLERVPEVRLEMIAPRWHVDAVVRAMKSTHPYEEVAYDVVPTETVAADYGMGVIGTLASPLPLRAFLESAKTSLGTGALRYAGNPDAMVTRVAVCGGSGGDLLPVAIARGADVFVTADVKYHSFRDAEGLIALVDAGHYETEHPVVETIVSRLQGEAQKAGEKVVVAAATTLTNPVRSI